MSILRYRPRGGVQHYPGTSEIKRGEVLSNFRFFNLTYATELQYKRLKIGNWPPPDSSPLHPIEPWGKQFFVFNTLQEGKPETLLCVADHSRKPLMYLRREDFQVLASIFESIKGELDRLNNVPREPDGTFDMQRLEYDRPRYAMQRMKTGAHSSHTIMRSTHRAKK
ncbi:hypothetical protein BEWA_022210 [Theileria equi strain WA]|uniref:Uncharacterized protein n=1 Tax=Theileria equi strain WA TaxID=1537102 RepID=L0AVW2_THEEQ|nr:hypothetical protein BEWA_022210 [Theileria equi strain WA]AFZ79373.1 hypothetical protein BEWA_022210 [Theileria equi strain WA]|eukprot:XP_004829039.1 hypothetical protein BEWA_022210 [Theileria equi strain WA]